MQSTHRMSMQQYVTFCDFGKVFQEQLTYAAKL